MNGRGKIHPTFIKNDRHVSLYMLDIGIDVSRPTLRINVNARPPIEPTNSFNDDNDLIGNERLGDHSKESLGDNSNESFSDHSMNIHDDPTNVENQPVDAEDLEPKCCEEMQEEQELGSQSNHSFSDGTNLCIKQTFSNENELQLLLAEAAAKKSFDFATVKSCTKYLKAFSYMFETLNVGSRYCIMVNKDSHRTNAAAAIVLEYDIDFEKWSRARFPGNRYDVMTTNIAESLNAMLIDEREYPVASIFNLIAKRKYDLIKIPCAHAMATLRSKHGNEYGMSIYE
ncbi:hypothetical protein KY284_026536 [Solanum tuberosum]|nr:hypothetical protein KY284_026536 [Solanum tuberosum]